MALIGWSGPAAVFGWSARSRGSLGLVRAKVAFTPLAGVKRSSRCGRMKVAIVVWCSRVKVAFALSVRVAGSPGTTQMMLAIVRWCPRAKVAFGWAAGVAGFPGFTWVRVVIVLSSGMKVTFGWVG
jgi:hypothetical protein